MLVVLRSEANQNSVSMRTELSSDLPKVRADSVQLQQVCMNLMLNAIEAMKDSGGILTICSGPTDKDQLLISVSDTGVGLPAEHGPDLRRIFYYQARWLWNGFDDQPINHPITRRSVVGRRKRQARSNVLFHLAG
jgi:signal transduction histidine kinase